jgi:Ion channel
MAEDADVAEDEDELERDLPGYRFGIVLFLLFATFIVESVGITSLWARVLTVALQGATLVAAFAAAEVGRHLMRLATIVAVFAFLTALVAAIADAQTESGWFLVLSFLLVFAAPVVIARSIFQRGVVDIHTVLGALCIYVMLGMLFAFLFGAIDGFSSAPFFVQTKHATSADYLYFSFVTLTTVGYGDLTAAGGLGRATAVIEALFGQLYLVTVVSMLVARLATRAMSPKARSPKKS